MSHNSFHLLCFFLYASTNVKLIHNNLRYSKMCPRFHSCIRGIDLQVSEIFVAIFLTTQQLCTVVLIKSYKLVAAWYLLHIGSFTYRFLEGYTEQCWNEISSFLKIMMIKSFFFKKEYYLMTFPSYMPWIFFHTWMN